MGKREFTNDQQICEKILKIINHQGKANQTHNEIWYYHSYNDYHQKDLLKTKC
jgi:hypothetical protein